MGVCLAGMLQAAEVAVPNSIAQYGLYGLSKNNPKDAAQASSYHSVLAAAVGSQQKSAAEQSSTPLQLMDEAEAPVTPVQSQKPKVMSGKDLVAKRSLIQELFKDRATWDLDDALKAELECALPSELMQQRIIEFRGKTKKQWRAWQASRTDSNETALNAALQALIEKDPQLKKAENTEQLAKWLRDMDISMTADVCIATMDAGLKKEKQYTALQCSVLGYPFLKDPQVHAIPVHAVENEKKVLSDTTCLQRILAILMVEYRRFYDTKYAKKRQEQLYVAGVGGDTAVAKDTAAASEEEYLGSFAGDAGIREAQAYAHAEAVAYIEGKLEPVNEALFCVLVRLEVVRVADACFSFPDAAKKSSEYIRDPLIYSMLIGMAYRIVQRVVQGGETILLSGDIESGGSGIQSLVYRAYTQQYGRLPSTVPSGEKAVGIERTSFEVHCVFLFGNIDFLRPRSFSEHKTLREALDQERVYRGMSLMKKIYHCYSLLRAVQWGLYSNPSEKALLAELYRYASEVKAYMKGLDLVIDSGTQLHDAFVTALQAKGITEWKHSDIFSVAPRRGLLLLPLLVDQPRGRKSKNTLVCRADDYIALYKVLWLYCATRLFCTLAYEKKFQHLKRDDFHQDAAAFDENGEPIIVVDEAQAAPEELSGLQKAQSFMQDTFARASYQAKNVRTKLAKGTTAEIVGSGVSALDDVSQFVEGIGSVLTGLYNQSSKESGRALAVFKALSLYVNVVGKMVNTKIKNLQSGLQSFSESMSGRAASWGLDNILLRRMREGLKESAENVVKVVNRDDAILRKSIIEAQTYLREAIKGTRTADQIPDAPQKGALSV